MTREVWRRLYPAVYIHPRRKSTLPGHGAEASATDGRALWEATMSYEEYCRLRMACLDMARQASLPDVRARWLAMAGAWLKVATDTRDGSHTVEERAAAPRLH
jgi:hypothetical protein